MSSELTTGLLVGVIAGVFAGVIGGLAVLVIALLQSPKQCPDCGEPVPKFRKLANRRQALWGGWTCTHCGCEIDRRGHKIKN